MEANSNDVVQRKVSKNMYKSAAVDHSWSFDRGLHLKFRSILI